MEFPLTNGTDSVILASNARSLDAPLPQWVREYPVPKELEKYLMERRRALLSEVAEIERILNLKPRPITRGHEL